MHLIIYVRFYYWDKCSKINCFISAKIFNLSIELTGVFKSYLNPGGSYSKSLSNTLLKIIFLNPILTFYKITLLTFFINIIKTHFFTCIITFSITFYNIKNITFFPIISSNIHFSLVKITYKNHKMSFNIIIYNIFNFIIFSFSFINFIISNIRIIIIIYNNSFYKFMINSNSRICRFRLMITRP